MTVASSSQRCTHLMGEGGGEGGVGGWEGDGGEREETGRGKGAGRFIRNLFDKPYTYTCMYVNTCAYMYIYIYVYSAFLGIHVSKNPEYQISRFLSLMHLSLTK